MEVLGYLHGAIAYESIDQAHPQGVNWSERLRGDQDGDVCLSGPQGRSPLMVTFPSLSVGKSPLHLLSLVLSLSLVVGTAAQATAAMRCGSSGSDVTQLQQNLTAAGFYDGPITGYYGELTQAAVMRFQQARGLSADGIAGPATLTALQNTGTTYQPTATPTTGGLSVGSSGPSVTRLQTQLTSLGIYSGPITGYYGPLTQAAVLRFQQANGITPSGTADAMTLAMLENTIAARPVNTVTVVQQPVPYSNPLGSLNSLSSLNSTGSIQPFVPLSASSSVSSAVTTSSPGRVLYRGDSGQAVADLQRSLNRAGVYQGPLTGYFGSLTEDAVLRFQQLNGIEPNGVAGPVTLEVLQSSIAPI